MVQKSKGRDLRAFPGMTDDLPDSFVDLIDNLLTYRQKDRPTAADMLSHEFVQFHKKLEDTGMTLDEITSAAAGTVPSDSDTRKLRRRTQSMRLTGSIQAHSLFLNYQQFARSLTTLLATLLSKADFDVLLGKIESHVGQEQPAGDQDGNSNVKGHKDKLQIIPINELEEILKEMNQDKAYVSFCFVLVCVCLCVFVHSWG